MVSNRFDLGFTVEQVDENKWRASLSDDLVTWEYGSTPYEAIANLCEDLEWEEEQEGE